MAHDIFNSITGRKLATISGAWHGLGMREDDPAPELPPEEPKGPMNKERAIAIVTWAIADAPSGSETEEDLLDLREYLEDNLK
jgi:hypothetical protein